MSELRCFQAILDRIRLPVNWALSVAVTILKENEI